MRGNVNYPRPTIGIGLIGITVGIMVAFGAASLLVMFVFHDILATMFAFSAWSGIPFLAVLAWPIWLGIPVVLIGRLLKRIT